MSIYSGRRSITILSIAAFCVAFGSAFWRWHGDSAMAAWVQAAFSVVAIGAAIWIAHNQSERDRRLGKEREQGNLIKHLEAILAICDHARRILDEIATRRNDQSYIDAAQLRRPEITQLEDAKTALAGIPLHDVAPWPVTAAVLTLLRSTGDVREMIANAHHLVISWSAERGEPFSKHAAIASAACDSVRDALFSTTGKTADLPGAASTQPHVAAFNSLSPHQENALPQHETVESANSISVHVQFSDATLRDVVSYFAGPQDPEVWPHQACIRVSDTRYRVWYNALPELSRTGLPAPD
jgi:hypothetical protein